jgi:invasion protein IalB
MLMKLGILFLAIGFSFVAVAGIVIQKTGVMIVDVQSKDGRVFLPIPMLLVNTALNFAPVTSHVNIPDELNTHSDIVQAAANELMRCPDGPFVEVITPNERVLVTKQGANIIVDVKSEDEKVYVKIPIQATGKVFAKLASLEPNAKRQHEFNVIGKN